MSVSLPGGQKGRDFTSSECSQLVRIVVSCAQMREAIETHPQTIVLSMLAISSSCTAYWPYYLMIEHTGTYNTKVVNVLHDCNVNFTLTGIIKLFRQL